MDPTLMAYMQHLSDQEMGNKYNPLEAGTQSGIQAAKKSMAMDETEKARARGLAFMALGQSLSRPGYGQGFSGTLNAINQSLPGAAQAYLGEEARVGQQNAMLHEQMQKEVFRQAQLEQQERLQQARLDQKRESEDLLQKHRAAQLAELQQYHKGRLGVEARKLESKELNAPASESNEGIVLNKMPRVFQNEFSKLALKSKDTAKTSKRTIDTINEMEQIFAEHPDIGSSFVNLLESEEGGISGKISRQLTRQFASEKTLTAVQRLRKLSADLNLSTVLGMPGKVATDLLKKQIQASAPGGNLTYDAFKAIAENWKKRAHENINEFEKYQEALKTGVYEPGSHISSQFQKEEVERPITDNAKRTIGILRVQYPGAIIMQDPSGKLRAIDPKNVEQAKQLGAIEIESE